jgi:hypothetical protein
MKRQMTLSIALVLSVVLLSLMSSDSAAGAQNQMRVVADTGIIRLGPHQVLHVSAAQTGDGLILGNLLTVRFRQLRYIEQDNLYKIASQITSPLITLAPNEGAFVKSEVASIDAADLVVWRTLVLSDKRNVRVSAMIIDTETGKTTQIIMANTEGDFH